MAKLLQKGYLKVSEIHKIYYELRGNKNGIPLVHILGGPGSSMKDRTRKLYPSKYKVLLFDQRGCGKSKPKEELRENTTQHLVTDIAKLMQLVGFNRAIIAGGSWGSTLALCFAIKYPEKVKKMIFSGIYLATEKENEYVFGKALQKFSPHLFEKLQKKYGHKKSYFRVLSLDAYRNNLESKKLLYATEMSLMATEKFRVKPAKKVYAHYLYHNFFLAKNYILGNIAKIKKIRCIIIHGGQDLLCPPETAYKVHKKIPQSKLYVVAGGHFMPKFKEQLYKHL